MPAHLFHLVNLIAMTGWFILIVFPAWQNTPKVILNGIIIALCGIYLYLLIDWTHRHPGGSFDSLAGVMLLFRDEKAALAGWIHYLAFDLFVGLWITLDAMRRGLFIGIRRWGLIVIQIFTFMFGPIGFILYYIVRRRKTKESLTSL